MIPKIKKILFATDLSKNSSYAFSYALSLAIQHEAKISFINVREKLSHNTELQLTAEDYESAQSKLIEIIKARINEYDELEKFDGCVYTKYIDKIIVKSGMPVEAIIRQSIEEESDLIVMGTHGHGILFTTFIGSTAKKMVQLSKIPVLVVRIPDHSA
ncbi:MAG: universal stress protein [Desulfuromonadales bacterium]|nr:universal stress protein [Desulfuromonadales bacterium]